VLVSHCHHEENNSELVKAKTKLDAATSEEDPTPGMTPATTDIVPRQFLR
jgi:hypothetical protein